MNLFLLILLVAFTFTSENIPSDSALIVSGAPNSVYAHWILPYTVMDFSEFNSDYLNDLVDQFLCKFAIVNIKNPADVYGSIKRTLAK